MNITEINIVAWMLAFVGGVCAISAAAMQGGWVAGLSAASTVFMSAAGVWGWTSKPQVKAAA